VADAVFAANEDHAVKGEERRNVVGNLKFIITYGGNHH